jgi:hypothetical protein
VKKKDSLTNRKLRILLVVAIAPVFLFSQVLELALSNAAIQSFGGNIYAYGLVPGEKKTALAVYKLDASLAKKDSLLIDLPRSNSADFLLATSDTLHDLLNIYLQKKNEKKMVTIFRLNRNFKLVGGPAETDVTKLNAVTAFENEVFYTKEGMYSIRIIADTSGKQFYLNKYSLKSSKENFDYEQSWQYPFERKNINSAHIIYADKKNVLVFANVMDGNKRGQWILKVNAQNGLFKKGIRIGEKGETNFYQYSAMICDTASGTIFVLGQKYNSAEFDQKEKKNSLSGKPNVTLYISEIDSAGETVGKNEFKFGIAEQKGYVNKVPVNYLFRVNTFSLNTEGMYTIEADLYKAGGSTLCYSLCNSGVIKINDMEGKLTAEKFTVGTNPMVEKYYVTGDKIDMNGRICIDSLSEMEKLPYKKMSLPVKLGFKFDDTNNPVWLLKKSETAKANENYTTLGPVKKVYQLSSLSNILKAENPAFSLLSLKQFILAKQIAADKFSLQIFNW